MNRAGQFRVAGQKRIAGQLRVRVNFGSCSCRPVSGRVVLVLDFFNPFMSRVVLVLRFFFCNPQPDTNSTRRHDLPGLLWRVALIHFDQLGLARRKYYTRVQHLIFFWEVEWYKFASIVYLFVTT